MSTANIPSAVPANFEKLKGRANYIEWKSSIRYPLEDRELYNACIKENAQATIDHRARSAIVNRFSNIVIKELFNCETD